MLVGEYTIPGETTETIALLADYCHPGQVNDSFSGLAVMMNLMRKIKSENSRKYTYKLLVFPETIGSCVYLHTNPILIDKLKFAVFSEFVAWGEEWLLTIPSSGQTIANMIARQLQIANQELILVNHGNAIGNDELVFDFCGIPSLSLQKTNVLEYHSSHDEPSRIIPSELEKASKSIDHMFNLLELDHTPSSMQKVPVYLTRFGLYNDFITQQKNYSITANILSLIDGEKKRFGDFRPIIPTIRNCE
jgi:aminopeptidase-like protein